MAKWLRYLLWTVLGLILLASMGVGLLYYKVKYGFARYETEAHEVQWPSDDRRSVLLLSKTTGYRHEEAIAASLPVFEALAQERNWFLYATEDAGIVNAEQLKRFDVVVLNNSTGRVFTDEQEALISSFVNEGGSLVAVHGAGDDSHRWPWYVEHVLGATFSHHPLKNQIQEANVRLSNAAPTALAQNLPATWQHREEWYIFDAQPVDKGFSYLLEIDGNSIDPDGNILWIKDKNFGMGPVHPVAWSRRVGQGRTFYTSVGHEAAAFAKTEVKTLLGNALAWSE